MYTFVHRLPEDFAESGTLFKVRYARKRFSKSSKKKIYQERTSKTEG